MGFRKLVPEFVFRHLHFVGSFKFYSGNVYVGKFHHSGTIIENCLFWRGIGGGHEKLSLMLWLRILEVLNPKIVIDIGANTGIYGVLTKIQKPQTVIHFFEPAIEFNSSITKSMNINNFFEGFYLHNVFLSEKNEESAQVYVAGNSDFPYVYSTSQGGSSLKRSVAKWRLEEYFDYFSKRELLTDDFQIDMVKIDIEGHEYQAMLGFGRYFSSKTLWLIEVLTDEAAVNLRSIFNCKDYYFVNINEASKSVRIEEELSRSLGWNVLVVPKSLMSKVEEVLSPFIVT